MSVECPGSEGGQWRVGYGEGIKDQPPLALKFGLRPWGKISASGCPVRLPCAPCCDWDVFPVGMESSISCSFEDPASLL